MTSMIHDTAKDDKGKLNASHWFTNFCGSNKTRGSEKHLGHGQVHKTKRANSSLVGYRLVAKDQKLNEHSPWKLYRTKAGQSH